MTTKTVTQELREFHEVSSMRNLTISDMPSNFIVGLFYFGISYSVLTSHSSQIGAYLFSTFGWSNEITSNLIGLVLGAAGVYMWIGNTIGNRFKIAAFPMMLYLGISTAAIVANRVAPGGLEMVALFSTLLLYRDFDADAKRRSLEDFARQKSEEVATLKTHLEKLQS